MKLTEMRNPNSMGLDKMSSLEIAKCINNEEILSVFLKLQILSIHRQNFIMYI